MKARLKTWWRLLLALPLAGAFAFESCTADTIRRAAEELDETANRIDGGDDDLDFGDWLADEIRDW